MPRRAITVAVAAVVTFGLIAAVAVFLLAREPEKLQVATPTTASSASPSPSRVASVPVDPGGVEACQLIQSATAADKLMDPNTAAAVEAASARSTEAGIYVGGAMFKDRQELAIAAKGRDKEFEYTLKALEAASTLAARCAAGGYFG